MYLIYGKQKEEESYKMLNVASGCFVDRKIHASMFESKEKAERMCYELEKENEGFFFESRKK
jgi:hypothetical protein